MTAGYSATRPDEAGRRLLLRPDVQAIIAERAKAVSDLAEMTTEAWARDLTAVALSNIGDLYKPDGSLVAMHDLPEHTKRAISSVEITADGTTKIRFWSKTAALETMAKHLGLFEKNKSEHLSSILVKVELVR